MRFNSLEQLFTIKYLFDLVFLTFNDPRIFVSSTEKVYLKYLEFA